MGIAKKIYGIFLKIRAFSQRKSFKVSLITILSFIFFFLSLNTYAQEEVEISPDWEGTKEFHNTMSGTEADEDNMNSRQGLEVLNAAWTGISLLAPELNENYGSIINNDNIPYDLKRGLIGLADDAGTTVYAIYPTVNIPEHLAQQWVPGYKDGVTSLYAQSTTSGHPNGYEELSSSGIAPLWTHILNISYVVFVVIMIIAGFMIMFRHKIGGQAMVTLGSVLPRVITSLILATFSFTIAGLVIDLGGVMSSIVSYVLGLGADTVPIGGLLHIMKTVFSGGLGTGSLITGAVGGLGLGAYLTGGFGIAALANPVGLAVTGAVGAIGLLLAIIVLLVILGGAIKVLITLYKAYFSLLLGVILAPIQITLGAIPGNNTIIKNWFLGIVRNVLVFPVVLFIVNLPNALVNFNSNVILKFPGKLTLEDPGSSAGFPINASGWLFIIILKIFVLYFAAQAPKYLEAWFPANSSPAMAKGFEDAKKGMSKIPLIGGMFKS